METESAQAFIARRKAERENDRAERDAFLRSDVLSIDHAMMRASEFAEVLSDSVAIRVTLPRYARAGEIGSDALSRAVDALTMVFLCLTIGTDVRPMALPTLFGPVKFLSFNDADVTLWRTDRSHALARIVSRSVDAAAAQSVRDAATSVRSVDALSSDDYAGWSDDAKIRRANKYSAGTITTRIQAEAILAARKVAPFSPITGGAAQYLKGSVWRDGGMVATEPACESTYFASLRVDAVDRLLDKCDPSLTGEVADDESSADVYVPFERYTRKVLDDGGAIVHRVGDIKRYRHVAWNVAAERSGQARGTLYGRTMRTLERETTEGRHKWCVTRGCTFSSDMLAVDDYVGTAWVAANVCPVCRGALRTGRVIPFDPSARVGDRAATETFTLPRGKRAYDMTGRPADTCQARATGDIGTGDALAREADDDGSARLAR